MSATSEIVRGIPVHFPFRPYTVQKLYMEKLIEALQTGKNALLESPTGTGKTLSLLCASLAWRLCRRERKYQYMPRSTTQLKPHVLRQMRNELLSQVFGTQWYDNPKVQTCMNVHEIHPKLFTHLETHSQLTQVVKELKNSKYKPRIAVLGSRQQLCLFYLFFYFLQNFIFFFSYEILYLTIFFFFFFHIK
eukprot:GSMAST32.ASY1.ANO1.1271.1 assembled CDS